MSSTAHRTHSWRRMAWLAGVAILYGGVAWLSLKLNFAGTNVSPVWPPSGLALAAMLIGGFRVSPSIWLGAFVANAAAFGSTPDLAVSKALWASALIASGNLGEATLGTALMRRLRRHVRLDDPADVYVFALVCLASALVSMAVGSGTLLALGLIPSELGPAVAFTWWLGDVTGMLVVTPLLLWLASPGDAGRGRAALRRVWPTAVAFALACWVVFGWQSEAGGAGRLSAIALVAAVVWASYRHGLGGAALSTFAMSCIAVQQTLSGRGLFAKATVNDSLISLDGFILLCTLAGLVVAASLRGARQVPASAAQTNIRWPVAVLTGGLTLTLVSWHLIAADTERRAAERFDHLAEGIVQRLVERMDTYQLALEGGRGLFDASPAVSAAQWRAYVAALTLQQRVPGIQGIGYALYIPAPQLAAHEQAMRAQGAPDYRVWPAGPRAEYTSIIYLEPFDARNRRAFAYDMFSEPVRHDAMARARQSGEAALSGRVTLLQENGEAPQAGFLMYVPVFDRRGGSGAAKASKDARLKGFVYAPFRVGDLMSKVLGAQDRVLAYVDLYDGVAASSRQRMFSSYDGAHPSYPMQYRQTRTVHIAGRSWSFDLASTPRFETGVDTQKAQISLVAGTLISLLMFSVMRALMLHRADALALAEAMTRQRVAVETRFQFLAETAGDAIVVASREGIIDYTNGTAERMFGHARGELLGRPLEGLFPEDERAAFAAWLQDDGATDVGGARASRRQMQRKDGSSIPVEVTLSHWQANGARYVGMVLRDITDHLAALGRLEQTKSLFSNVLDNIPAMVGLWDRDLRNRYCNREYEDWFGLRAEEVYGRHIREVLGETLFELNKGYMAQALAGEHVSFERTIRSPDGRTRYAQAHYLPDVHDHIVKGFFVLVFDITPLNAARQALQHNLKLHDLIFHHAGVGIAFTRHRRYERVSREFTRLLGYEEGELDGEPSSRVFPDAASYDALSSLAAETLPAGKLLDVEAFLLSKRGEPIWCHILARAVDPQDEAQGTIWIVQDFRDRKQQQELLERARADAESAARLKANFLANMSHEIRTPMNGIIGLTALTLDTALTPLQHENLTMVQESARSLLGLLNDILDFSKIDAGKLTLERAPFDLRDQLAIAVAPAAMVAWHKGVDFIVDVGPEVPERLWGDALRFVQVVRNLADNAAKFTAQGEIVCKVEHRAAGADGVQLSVEVADTGPGIPDHIKASIFEAFVQADSSVTRQYGGTGLGLTICAQIVTMMGGDIQVRSELGQGARFSFTALFDDASPAPALGRAQAAALEGRCVGVVSRTQALREALQRQLSAWRVCSVDPLKADGTPEACDAWIVDGRLWQASNELAGAVQQLAPDKVIMMDGPLGAAAGARDWPHRLRQPVKTAALADMLASMLAGAEAVSSAMAPPGDPQAKDGDRPLDLLLAEDHPVNQRLARSLLEKRGHRVTLASNGSQALELACRHAFDLILMDVQMPAMDGVTATRALRQFEAEAGRYTPVIALTAHALHEEIDQLLAQGFDAYLAKPFDPRELTRMVSALAARFAV